MLQDKVLELYRRIKKDFFKAREDLKINDRTFNSTLLFELIGFLNRCCVMLFGDYGQGKTTSAELVGSVMAGLPYPAIVACEVRGSPEITDEKVVARVNLGKLQQGIEEVMWSSFCKSPVHVVDEITRIPSIKQSLILEGIRTGRWLYLGQLLDAGGRTPLYATANFEDLTTGGSFNLIPALVDRFSLGLDSSYPGTRACLEIALDDDFEVKLERAGLAARVEEAITLLSREYDRDAIRKFTEEFKRHLESHGFTPLYAEELERARHEIQQLPLSEEAVRFTGFVISLLNYCCKTGQKRSAPFSEDGAAQRDCPQDCKFYDTPCAWMAGGGSRRQERDIVQTARALAWLLGGRKVDVEHIRACAPFCLWHRRKFSRNFLNKVTARKRRYRYPLKLEAACAFVDEVYREYDEEQDLLEHVHKHEAQLRRKTQADGASIEIWGQRKVKASELHPYIQDLLELDGGEAVEKEIAKEG